MVAYRIEVAIMAPYSSLLFMAFFLFQMNKGAHIMPKERAKINEILFNMKKAGFDSFTCLKCPIPTLVQRIFPLAHVSL